METIYQITNGRDGDVEIKIANTTTVAIVELTLSKEEFKDFCEEIDRVREIDNGK